jgi:hypothetical protein
MGASENPIGVAALASAADTRRRSTMHAQDMISTHPQVKGTINAALIACIEACYDCAQVCTSCADACLGEAEVAKLTQCIRFNLDCAAICDTTGAVATRRTGSNEVIIRQMLHVCAIACRACAEDCERHTHMQHCKVCAETCRRCEQCCHEAHRSLAN